MDSDKVRTVLEGLNSITDNVKHWTPDYTAGYAQDLAIILHEATKPVPEDDVVMYGETYSPDSEGDEDRISRERPCAGHVWVCTGTQYGGDDASFGGEGRVYCSNCGADGDA